jgi:hypothetical protein
VKAGGVDVEFQMENAAEFEHLSRVMICEAVGLGDETIPPIPADHSPVIKPGETRSQKFQ